MWSFCFLLHEGAHSKCFVEFLSCITIRLSFYVYASEHTGNFKDFSDCIMIVYTLNIDGTIALRYSFAGGCITEKESVVAYQHVVLRLV